MCLLLLLPLLLYVARHFFLVVCYAQQHTPSQFTNLTSIQPTVRRCYRMPQSPCTPEQSSHLPKSISRKGVSIAFCVIVN